MKTIISPITQGAKETFAEMSWKTSIPAGPGQDFDDFDLTTMCAVTMNTLNGISYGNHNETLEHRGENQMFLFGGTDGWSYNRWFTVDPQHGSIDGSQLIHNMDSLKCRSLYHLSLTVGCVILVHPIKELILLFSSMTNN